MTGDHAPRPGPEQLQETVRVHCQPAPAERGPGLLVVRRLCWPSGHSEVLRQAGLLGPSGESYSSTIVRVSGGQYIELNVEILGFVTSDHALRINKHKDKDLT